VQEPEALFAAGQPVRLDAADRRAIDDHIVIIAAGAGLQAWMASLARWGRRKSFSLYNRCGADCNPNRESYHRPFRCLNIAGLPCPPAATYRGAPAARRQ
jgi:hypothetical protein